LLKFTAWILWVKLGWPENNLVNGAILFKSNFRFS